MRQFHINNPRLESPIKNEIRSRLKDSISHEEMLNLLFKEFENGNSKVIDSLINCMNEIIYKVMLSLPESSFDLDARLEHAKTSLRKFALMIFGASSRNYLSGFVHFKSGSLTCIGEEQKSPEKGLNHSRLP